MSAEPRIISIELLKSLKACESQVAIFRETFGESAPLTVENLEAANAAGLNLDWFAKTLLPGRLAVRYRRRQDELLEARTASAFTIAADYGETVRSLNAKITAAMKQRDAALAQTEQQCRRDSMTALIELLEEAGMPARPVATCAGPSDGSV